MWKKDVQSFYALHILFLTFAVPAMRAEPARVDADGFYQVIQAVEAECGKVQAFPDFFHHLSVILTVRVCIVVQNLLGYMVSFPFTNDAPGDQIIIGCGTGKIKIGTGRQALHGPLWLRSYIKSLWFRQAGFRGQWNRR